MIKKAMIELKKVERELYPIYEKLAQLEISGRKNTLEYQEEFNKLPGLFVQEREFVRKIKRMEDVDSAEQFVSDLINEEDDLESDNITMYYRMLDLIQIRDDSLVMRGYPFNNSYDEEDDIIIDEFEKQEVLLESDTSKRFETEVQMRLQERIDNAPEKEKDALILEKYKLLYNCPVFDEDILFTGFDFSNMFLPDVNLSARSIGVSDNEYEDKFYDSCYNNVQSLVFELVQNEFSELEPDELRIKTKIVDLELEVSLSYLPFDKLIELKEWFDDKYPIAEIDMLLTYNIFIKNMEEAINYACNYEDKLKTKPWQRVNYM